MARVNHINRIVNAIDIIKWHVFLIIHGPWVSSVGCQKSWVISQSKVGTIPRQKELIQLSKDSGGATISQKEYKKNP